eukprot:GFUD01042135.1.p1 GENE.GFUD01042135.1~~GFUD01042135.1.p1  ORF type:complete len:329 (-),score=125.47 GFUD01042135.1:318-1304(-)
MVTVTTVCSYAALLVYSVSFAAAGEPEVEIADLFGDVLFQQGIPQSITCTVFDPLPVGVFTWKVGDRIIENNNRIENIAEDEIQQVLQFTPTLEDSKKPLTCQYGERGEQVYSDYITMGIYVMDIPSDPITPGLVKDGDPVTLKVTAGLYPAPAPGDILWEVKEPSGEVVVEMSPGGQDMYGIYRAGEIEVLSESDNLYQFSLDIAVLDQKEVSNIHTVTITTKGIKKTVHFNLALKMTQGDEVEGTNEDVNQNPSSVDNNKETKEEEPNAGVLGMEMGLFIIIGIIAVFLILCITYCIYRRKKKSRSKNSKTYTAVKTNTNMHGQPV